MNSKKVFIIFGKPKNPLHNRLPDLEPSLAIIIVNWNSYKDTANCLRSLRLVDYTNHKAIVVDNGSEDGSGSRLQKEFPEIVLLVNDKNLGFTGGNNRGLRYALDEGFETLMLLNNDTIVTPNFINFLQASLKHEAIGAVQPKIMFNKERNVIWNAGSNFNRLFTLPSTVGINKEDLGQFDKARFIPWITGCCFLVKSSVIKEVGLLDDRFFIYYEDTDWSLRIRERGFKLKYVPESIIYHEVGRSDENRSSQGEGNLSPFSHYITVRNEIFLMRKHSNVLTYITSSIYQLFKLAAYISYFTIKRRPKKRNASIRGFMEGYKTSLVVNK